MFLFLIVLISGWVVASSRMAEKTSRLQLLPSFLRARLTAAATTSLSSSVLRCCFSYSTPPLCAINCKASQDIVSMSTAFYLLRIHHYIEGEGGQWFSSTKPAHRRGCLLECDVVSNTLISSYSGSDFDKIIISMNLQFCSSYYTN